MNRFIVSAIAVSIVAGSSTAAVASERRFEPRKDGHHYSRAEHPRAEHRRQAATHHRYSYQPRHGWRNHQHRHHRPVVRHHRHGHPPYHRASVHIESRHHGHFVPTVVGAVIGGSIGNHLGHGDAGATAVGAVIGAAAANHRLHR